MCIQKLWTVCYGITPPVTNTDQIIPPVLVELSVTKAEQLSGEVQRRVEEPIEKHQPKQVIGNLEKGTKQNKSEGVI